MKQKYTKIDIIDSIYRNNPQYQLKQVQDITNLFLDELSLLLKKGVPVEIRGLGSFDFAVLKEQENARNPKTGEMIQTPARCKIRFRPGKGLRESLHMMDAKKFITDEK